MNICGVVESVILLSSQKNLWKVTLLKIIKVKWLILMKRVGGGEVRILVTSIKIVDVYWTNLLTVNAFLSSTLGIKITKSLIK